MFAENPASSVFRLFLLIVLIIGMSGMEPIRPVLAATQVVTNTNDSGAGSLRQAIADADSGSTITFHSTLSGQTIVLSSTLTIDKDLTIDGSALDTQIIISGNNTVRVLQVEADVTATIDSLVIKSGNLSNSNGGGIYNSGSLIVSNSVFEDNQVYGLNLTNHYGGAVFNYGGVLTVTGSMFISNSGDGDGGAIYSLLGVLTVTNSTFDSNTASRGGAIFCQAGTMVLIENSYFSNTASAQDSGDGGAIYGNCDSVIENSTFAGNTATGHGGAIHTDNDTHPTEVTNSTFYGNAAPTAGGIANYGGLIVTNSTFSGNSATYGGAIRNGLGGVMSLRNSILANSVGGVDCLKSDGAPEVENIHNLIETTGTEFESCGTSLLSSDPLLSPLQDNGGFTQTMAPGSGSPAIDAGDDITCSGADQRGVARPQGSHCDIGAYEVTFTDVPSSHPYFSDIEILYANGLTAGCMTTPLKFCPDQTMDRAQSAVFMLRGSLGVGYEPPTSLVHRFKDNWTPGPWAEKWAEGMFNAGLTSGCTTSGPLKFCPWEQMPREQAVIFGLRLKYGNDYTPPPATGTLFADMTNPSYYATKWAEQAYTDGLIPACGMSGGKPKFCPQELVTRGLGAYIIVRAKDLSMP